MVAREGGEKGEVRSSRGEATRAGKARRQKARTPAAVEKIGALDSPGGLRSRPWLAPPRRYGGPHRRRPPVLDRWCPSRRRCPPGPSARRRGPLRAPPGLG